MTDLKAVQKLTDEANVAAQKAVDLIRPAHDEALTAARKLRDDLDASTSNGQQIRACVDLIEKATAKRKPNLDAAAAIAAQFMGSVCSVRHIGVSQQQNGAYWLATLPRYVNDWKPAQRVKILDAFVLATQGKISAGLVEFPASLAEALDVDAAQALADLADPDGYAKHQSQQAALADELGEAQSYVDALEQATPQLLKAQPTGGAGVSVVNHRPGSITVKGIQFKGGSVTTLTGEEYNRIRDHFHFKSHIESGLLALTTTGTLATAI